MVIESNFQHIMILLRLEQPLYAGIGHIALVEIVGGRALIMVALQGGYD
jgi:hypothetical protein